MKVQYNTKITEITHDDIVNLLSTAFCGSTSMSFEYDKDFFGSLKVNQTTGDCYEDHAADVLLNGGKIYVFDEYAEGTAHGKDGEVLDDGTVMYSLTLEDIRKGLENAFNGNVKTGGFDDEESLAWIRDCAEELSTEECMDFDIRMADALMQVILFGEVIYG